ncbi:hypothetical protein AOLI_G00049610 [Acnodon oligacanthus]
MTNTNSAAADELSPLDLHLQGGLTRRRADGLYVQAWSCLGMTSSLLFPHCYASSWPSLSVYPSEHGTGKHVPSSI